MRGKLEFSEKAKRAADQRAGKAKKEMDKNLDVPRKRSECSQTVEAAKTKKKTLEKQIAGNKETDMEELVQARRKYRGEERTSKADG